MIAAALLALFLAAPPPPPEDPQVRTAVEEYRRGEYEAARSRLQEVVTRETLPKHERVRAHLHLGFCEVAFGNRTAAKVEFKQALLLDPTVTLDPMQVSPKIIDVFDEARREMPRLPRPTQTPIANATPVPTPKAPVRRVDRLGAAARSAAVPGWGQLAEGRAPTGAAFLAADVAAIGFLVWNQQQVGVAQKNVRRAQELQKDQMRGEVREFETYRNLSAVAVVAITAAAATDAWLGAKRVRVGAAPTGDGAMVAFSARF